MAASSLVTVTLSASLLASLSEKVSARLLAGKEREDEAAHERALLAHERQEEERKLAQLQGTVTPSPGGAYRQRIDGPVAPGASSSPALGRALPACAPINAQLIDEIDLLAAHPV